MGFACASGKLLPHTYNQPKSLPPEDLSETWTRADQAGSFLKYNILQTLLFPTAQIGLMTQLWWQLHSFL